MSRSARFLEPQIFSDEIFKAYHPSPKSEVLFDIVTEHVVLYDAFHVWKVRLLATTDSTARPQSTRDSLFALTYERNPLWFFCATRYRFEPLNGGARRLVYVDFPSRKEVVMELSAKWPRAWHIEEVAITQDDALLDVWEASKRK